MSVYRTVGPLVPETHAKLILGDNVREALLRGSVACSPGKKIENLGGIVRRHLICRFGIFWRV